METEVFEELDMISRNMMVLDLETQKSFADLGKSRGDLGKLKVSVVGVYDYADDQYRTYEEKDIMILEKRLREVEVLIGFNIRGFDMPVLAPYLFTSVELLPLLDLMEDVEKYRGHRASLDSLVRPTLGQQKTGQGKDAIILFQEKRMEELKSYCLTDVRLTKELFEYGCAQGQIKFTSSRDYQTYDIPVHWKETAGELVRKASAHAAAFPASLF